jgi:hypothetical protein
VDGFEEVLSTGEFQVDGFVGQAALVQNAHSRAVLGQTDVVGMGHGSHFLIHILRLDAAFIVAGTDGKSNGTPSGVQDNRGVSIHIKRIQGDLRNEKKLLCKMTGGKNSGMGRKKNR